MKKRILVSFLLLGAVFEIQAQNTFPIVGNVGIGTALPNARLEIHSPSNSDDSDLIVHSTSTSIGAAGWSRIALKRINESNEGFLSFYGNRTSGLILGVTGDNPIRFFNDGIENMRILSNGTIGMGTRTPTNDAKLHIITNKKGGIFLEVNHAVDYQFGIISAVNRSNTKALSVLLKTGNTYQDTFAVMGDGEVLATEITVQVPIFPDFVFEKDYDLPSLKEVEAYIAANGHLEDIPSAEEALEKGVQLGEMNTKLLQKIEELTLYAIQQQKAIDALKAELIELKGNK